MTEPERYRARRRRLLERMGSGIAVIPTAPEVTRNADSHYDYRPDSSFHYLTGFPEPEAVLVLLAGDAPRELLFCRDKDTEREIWDGFRHGPEGAAEHFGIAEALSLDELDETLTQLMGDQPALWYPLGLPAWDARLSELRGRVRAAARSGVLPPPSLRDIRPPLDEMRLIKDGHEQDLMRQAADISARAHVRAMRHTRPGQYEYEIEAELLHEFCRHGARQPAYTSIVAGGGNACTLHYVGNDAKLRDGDLLLIDAGCEFRGYAADITRTFPINGRFDAAQRDVYTLVLAAQTAAIAAVRPGNSWNDPHTAAVRVLAQGFIDLGLCRGTLDAVLEQESYKRFYMHRTGHWLGRDVHDAGNYKQAGDWRCLSEDMVLTVEPGCYIRPADDIPLAFWNIGIRIEDDVRVTATGCEVLTAAAPKTVDEIEECMRHE